jgi:hypothetical protein
MNQDTFRRRTGQALDQLAEYQMVACALLAIALVISAVVEVFQ